MITGADLVKMGYKPHKRFKEALEFLNTQFLPPCEGAIRVYMDSLIPPELKPREEPAPYTLNIRAIDDGDQENIDKVVKDMNSVMRSPTAIHGAIMPDACPTGDGQIPVGGVVVTKNAIHPNFHSSDICCSLMASNLGNVDPFMVMEIAHSKTHFGAGGRKRGEEYRLPPELAERIKANQYTRDFMTQAISHLGTQGDGNHFLFVGTSKTNGETYIVTHHGSRGFGAGVFKKGKTMAEKFRRDIAPTVNPLNAWIPFNTDEGEEYWEALQIVRDWTKLNHECIHNSLTLDVYDNFWNEHNFVFKDGDTFYHAKGATPMGMLPEGNYRRLIPLNMAEPILVVEGGNEFGFAPHGAGRNMSRTQHKKNQEGRDIQDIFWEETKGLDVRFYSGEVDISELPSAYKKAETVKTQIEEYKLGTIIDEIVPYGCIMAGRFLNTRTKKQRQ